MTKEALSAAVAAKLDVTKSFGEDAVNAVLDSITEALAEKENVVLIGFGKFEPKWKASRTAKNLKTGEPIQIVAHYGIKFTPGKKLKDIVAK